MSMPSFPPCGADMTKDEALTMIIASIAMEELALSYIVNAEGEKLQYVLGTLPGSHKPCASTQEILAVNKSAAALLDTVMQSQMLLKGKLEKALEASGCDPAQGPPCPPSHPCEPPCGGPSSCRKSAIHLVSQRDGFSWDNGCPLSWRCQDQQGCGIRQDEENPAQVELDAGKAYALNYAINICGPYRGNSAGAVRVKLTPCDAFSDVLPLNFSVRGLRCEPLTLHYSTVLFPQACPPPCADLSLLLDYRDSLFVEQASLNIFEI
ncbi:MAG: hypothetical protein K2M42_04035 [Oscillospiraceae bacterium]|nr:hypothetical protein [Oscillospiraceae bacterium]